MARYTPKSKISVSQTNGNEFLVESTKAPFQGTYMEFSNGTFFAGSDPQRKGQRLIRIEVLKDNFESGFNNMKYNNLKPNIYKNLSKIDSIPPSKPEPTVEDYKRGYFIRYFCKILNIFSLLTSGLSSISKLLMISETILFLSVILSFNFFNS